MKASASIHCALPSLWESRRLPKVSEGSNPQNIDWRHVIRIGHCMHYTTKKKEFKSIRILVTNSFHRSHSGVTCDVPVDAAGAKWRLMNDE
jgi:hypothetical protein